MPLQFVSGDPLLTQCQSLAIGHNRAGRTETNPLPTALRNAYPVAYATYERRCKQNRQASGDLYLWTQSKPQLLFLTVRDSAVGANRLRYIQSCLMTIVRDYRLYNIKDLALAPIASPQEWTDIKALMETWFSKSELSVIVYVQYQPGVLAEKT